MGVRYVRRCPRCWAGDNTRSRERVVDGVRETCSLCRGDGYVSIAAEPMPEHAIGVQVDAGDLFYGNVRTRLDADPDAPTQPIALDDFRPKPAPVDPVAWARALGERQAIAMEEIGGLLAELEETGQRQAAALERIAAAMDGKEPT